ncbi:MAG: hypothetical protein ACREDR_03810 [Blastocatellia bacterium]
MPRSKPEHEFFNLFSEADRAPDEAAPSRLKSRIYSTLIAAEQESGPLRSLQESHSSGHGLCVFERLVQIAPIGEKAKSPFFCWVCHGRVLGENIEHAPIRWKHCPYADFQEH